MTLDQIKQAINDGKNVYHVNKGYKVIRDKLGQYLIVYTPNQYTIGLTWQDGITLNGKENDFFVA